MDTHNLIFFIRKLIIYFFYLYKTSDSEKKNFIRKKIVGIIFTYKEFFLQVHLMLLLLFRLRIRNLFSSARSITLVAKEVSVN